MLCLDKTYVIPAKTKEKLKLQIEVLKNDEKFAWQLLEMLWDRIDTHGLATMYIGLNAVDARIDELRDLIAECKLQHTQPEERLRRLLERSLVTVTISDVARFGLQECSRQLAEQWLSAEGFSESQVLPPMPMIFCYPVGSQPVRWVVIEQALVLFNYNDRHRWTSIFNNEIEFDEIESNDLVAFKRWCTACQTAAKRKLQVCSGCRIARYCSAECQKAHWSAHSRDCRVLLPTFCQPVAQWPSRRRT
jgi:hypothetical protein